MPAKTGARSRRFALQLQAWFRTPDESQWHSGVTENVSGSGVVICCMQPRRPGDVVNVRIELPSPDRQRVGVLTGTGRVVRIIGSNGTAPAFAIAVKRYRLQRRGDTPDPTCQHH